MPYYNRDPKVDPNFDNHPYVLNKIRNWLVERVMRVDRISVGRVEAGSFAV